MIRAKVEVTTKEMTYDSRSSGANITNWNAVRAKAEGPNMTQTLLLTSLVL